MADGVQHCRSASWREEERRARPELRHQSGRSTIYTGQTYDPAKAKVVLEGWDHGHCEICWWSLFRSEDPERGVGDTDGDRWLFAQCYTRFVAVSVASLPGPLPDQQRVAAGWG